MEKIKQKDRSRIAVLRSLCQKKPELMICELAELIEVPIEKTFFWIKKYDIPYHWKLHCLTG